MASVICHGCGMAFDPPEGYTRAKVQCPGCGVICAVPAGARREPAPATSRKATPPAEEDWFRDEPKAAPKEEEPVEADVDEPAVPAMELVDDATPEDDEDDPSPYDLRDKIGPRCPGCRMEMEVGSSVCVRCGMDRRTRRKAKRTYEPVYRVWDSDRSLANRLMWVGVAQAYHFFLGFLCLTFFGTMLPALIAWFPLTALLLFLLGTYDRITLTRDEKGRVRLVKQWRFAFVPLPPVTTDVRGFEGVVTGPWLESGIMEWFVLISLLSWGLIPGIVWYYCAIHLPNYLVALAEDHGRPEVYVYRGRNQEQMNEIADAICAAAGLRRLG